MKTQQEFKDELLRRKQAQTAAQRRRSRVIITCTSLILCLVLLAGLILKPATVVNAADLMANIRPRPVTGKDADDAFIHSQTDFALRLMRECNSEKNTLISPLSVMLALSMTANGAGGQTKAEMEAVLGMTTQELNAYLHNYVNHLTTSKTAKLAIANSVWYRDADYLQVNPAFLQTAMDYYAADAYKAPFHYQTVQDMNNWVKENTDGMIDWIIDEINPDNELFLINALMFDAKWSTPYRQESQIRPGTFHAANGTDQNATMMHGTENTYLRDANATGFLKYYEDHRYAFVALLPNEGVSVSDYLNSLTPEALLQTLSTHRAATVYTAMPKFSYDYGIALSDTLKSMGMPTAFDKDYADFSPMATADRRNLFIGKVLHKTHITVDTEGTRAGAVTSASIDSITDALTEVYEVTLDRPFVYLILDTETNLPIFIGTVMSVS